MILNKFSSDAKPKTTIAFLRFNLDAVGENFIYEEAQYLEKYSPVVLCGTIKRLDKKINYYCHKEFIKLYQSQWPLFSKSQQETYHNGIRKYQNILNNQHVKLIHAQFLTDAVFCHRLIKESGLPLVVNLRGYDLFHPRVKFLLATVSPFVSKFVVKAESMKAELISFGCNPSKIEVIYGGINTDKIIFKPRVPTGNKIKILSAGRFVDKKGYDTTLKFFDKLLKMYPKAELTLVGEGKLKGHLMKLIDRLGIAAKVNIKGYRPHPQFIKELYKHNLFVLPSRTAKNGDKEGIPNVLKEAMASGMPVISTYHSGIPELITDQETGYLVKENDYAGILDKVNFILKNNEKAFFACLNARFFVEKNFNAKKTAQQVERLYDYLLMQDYAKSAIDLREGKRPSEFRVDLHLNKGCNSKCIMCNDWKNNITTSYSRQDITDLLDQLRLFGVNHVRFHGQEPTLMKEIFSIMEEAKESGFRVGLKTNALIFSNEKKLKMLPGQLDDLYLSIDSSDEKIHNLLRGNNRSFKRNMFLCENLRKTNPNVKIYFNAVVTKINYQNLVGLLDTAASMKVNRVSFVHLSTNNKEDIKNLKLSKEQFREFYFQIWPRILKKSRDYRVPVCIDPYFTSLIGLPVSRQITRLNSPSADFNEEINNFADGLYGKEFYNQNTCYGLLDHATIDWEGNVFPCCAMPRSREFAVGNVLKKNYTDIWNSDKYMKYRENILKGECQFKDRCSRAFERTVEYNNYFEKQNNGSPGVLEDFQNQYRDNKYTHRYNLERLVYYAFSKSMIYREKFREFVELNGKFDFSALPSIKRDELKYSFPDKGVVPNYFDEDYGAYKTSSCGSKAFLYARPLRSNIFPRMATSFIHTGKWKIGQPWLKLTSLNCLESQYPLKSYSSSANKESRVSSATVIPSSDNFINEPTSRIKDIYDLIKTSHASLIHTNPTHLKLLLYRFKQEKLKLNDRYAVHSTYETLLPSTKKLIQKYLNCRVYNQYGCSELGPISFSCHCGNNHIFSDTVHVEIIPDNQLNRPGIGRVFVTHLKNYVMPFVKYFNGDFAYILKNKKCECGLKSPVMGDIVGRKDEIINYKGQAAFPLELDGLFCDLNNVLMYQVIFENNQFFVKLVPENKAKSIFIKKILSGFKRFFNDKNLEVHVEKVDFVLPKRRGKYASVIVK